MREHNASPERSRSPTRVPPIYKSTLGPSFYGHRNSAPVYSFSKGSLENRHAIFTDKELAKHDYLLLAKNPCSTTYNPVFSRPATQGGILPSNMRWASCTTGRINMEGDFPYRGPPGPGTYRPSTSQTVPSTAQAGFSNYCVREARQVTYVSRGHERERFGTQSPGPATAKRDLYHSVGRQLNSTKPTQPRCTFARTSRFKDVRHIEKALGPGQYDC